MSTAAAAWYPEYIHHSGEVFELEFNVSRILAVGVTMSNSIISPGLTLREKDLRVGQICWTSGRERTGLENFQQLE
jgi:hypothetical protein